jgi:hypothetical protein
MVGDTEITVNLQEGMRKALPIAFYLWGYYIRQRGVREVVSYFYPSSSRKVVEVKKEVSLGPVGDYIGGQMLMEIDEPPRSYNDVFVWHPMVTVHYKDNKLCLK